MSYSTCLWPDGRRRPRLLVSVRSSEEATAALEGGAAVIDVKEPARGSLGMADAETIASVVRVVNGAAAVSAALGELNDWVPGGVGWGAASDGPLGGARFSWPSLGGARYVKVGLAGCAADAERVDWRSRLNGLRREARGVAAEWVAVAYADWRRAEAPPPGEVLEFGVGHGWGLLVDTWLKDGTNLLDWMDREELKAVVGRAREAGVASALAGSLTAETVASLLPLGPDFFAVRGAACYKGRRQAAIDPAAVRRLVRVLERGWSESSARAAARSGS